MLDLLIDKLQNYQDPKTYPINQGKYYIEELESGIVMTNIISVVFFQNDGKILRLSKTEKSTEFEWKLHCELANIVEKKNNCRIELPIRKDIIKVDNLQYHYLEVQRPGGELGINFLDEYEKNTIDTEYFLDYISQVSEMLDNLIILGNKCNFYNLPMELLSTYKRNKDSYGYFWVDFKHWEYTIDKFIEKKIRTLYLTLLNFDTIDFDYNLIMYKAEKDWSRYLK